ncbi:glycoside hydrolase family 3 C-terminal domain-containing protein [Microbacterium sp. AGC85]
MSDLPQPAHDHVLDLDLDLDQKASLVAGASTWSSRGIEDFVPALTLSDGPHGLRRQMTGGDNLGIGSSVPAVCFPPAVGLAATWNPDLVERVGREIGREARALDVQVVLGPGMNIKRSPLGGRNFEYFSEDPHVTGSLAAAMVRGIQSMHVAATPKHFAVNNQENDRMRVSATVGDRALREIYLAAFEHVVREAGPWALMSAYNRVNGEFASESRRLLTEILRDEWGFDGLVVSDWGAVYDHVSAVAAGLDLEMPPSGNTPRIVQAVLDGDLDERVLDVAISRLRTLAARTTGLPAMERDIPAAESVALDAAREAVTLLENDGVLPLAHDQRVLVVGEFARTPRFQGGGSSRVVPTRTVSALDALRELSGSTVSFAPGFTLHGDSDAALAEEAVTAASDADVVVLFLGLSDRAESEGFDRTTLALPSDQLELLARLKSVSAPLVIVLSNGSTVELSSWRDGVGAIVEGWLLGQEGGRAIAEVLLGDTNPSGRLTETIPHRLEDTPSHLNFPGLDGEAIYGEDVFVGYRGYDTRGTEVAYPFGHGLSYTTFAYESMEVTATGENTWDVRIGVHNAGDRVGSEVVQLYVAAQASGVARPSHELRDFRKVRLSPGERSNIAFEVTARDLSHWNAREQRWQIEPGDYRIEIGASSRDIRVSADVHSAGDRVVLPLRLDSTLEEWAAHPLGADIVARMRAGIPAEIADSAPELAAMVLSTPVIKLATWGLGITEELVRGVVAQSGGDA